MIFFRIPYDPFLTIRRDWRPAKAAANPKVFTGLRSKNTDGKRVSPVRRSQGLAAGLYLDVPAPRLRRTLAICLPLALTVLAAKILKASSVIFPLSLQTFDHYFLRISSQYPGLFIAAASLPVVLALSGTQINSWGNSRCLLIAVIAMVVADVVLLSSGLHSSLVLLDIATFAGKKALRLFALLRWDLAFLLGFLASSLLIIQQCSSRRSTRLATIFLLCFQAPLLLLIGLDTAWQLHTGEPGSGALLFYVFSQTPGLMPIAFAKANAVSFSIAATPLALLVLQGWYVLHRSRLAHVEECMASIRTGMFIWPVLAILILTPAFNPAEQPAYFTSELESCYSGVWQEDAQYACYLDRRPAGVCIAVQCRNK